MSIQSIGASPPPRSAERPAAEAAPAPAQAKTTAAAPNPPTQAAAAKTAAAPTADQVKDAVANINKSLQALSQDLVFSVDADSNRTVVKLVDQKTKEVIRQIPTQQALEISKVLDATDGKATDALQGLLLKQTA